MEPAPKMHLKFNNADTKPEEILMRDIDAWLNREINDGTEPVPSEWHDYTISERLACYLTSIGWSKR